MQFLKAALVWFITLNLLFIHVSSSPTLLDSATTGELSDLNTRQKSLKNDNSRVDDIAEEKDFFSHVDEDASSNAKLPDLSTNLKYDVELLEPSDPQNVSANLEELFREPAIKTDTNIFSDEDIEMHHVPGLVEESHLVWSFVLVSIGFLALGIYVGLVSWRSYLERRYGSRQLLATSEHDDLDHDHTVLPADLIIANIVGSHHIQQQSPQQQQQQSQHQRFEHLQKQLQQHHMQWQQLQRRD